MGSADTSPSTSQLGQELQAAREEAELTLEQLHLVQEELEVYFLKAEELSEALALKDQQTSELQQQLEAALQAATESLSKQELKKLELHHANAVAQLQSQHEAEIAKSHNTLAERDKQLKAIQPELEQAQQRQNEALARTEEAQARALEAQDLLRTAQKMLEGQANYLQDLSRKEEEAELALEREQQIRTEVLYYFQNSIATSTLDPSRIPRLRALLQKQLKSRASRQP